MRKVYKNELWLTKGNRTVKILQVNDKFILGLILSSRSDEEFIFSLDGKYDGVRDHDYDLDKFIGRGF